MSVGFAAAPRIGFTSPTTIYEKMRTLDREADALNQDVLANVASDGTSGAYKRAWMAWYAQWKTFFAKTLDEKVGNLLHTDALDTEVDGKRSEFLGFKRDYPLQHRPDGTLVPAPSVPAPAPLPKAGSGPGGESILPWWGWMIGGIAVVGLGYLGYRKYQELTAKRKAIETEVLPGVLGGFFGPKTGHSLAKAAAARDMLPPGIGRRDPSRDPFNLAFYGDPRNAPPPMPRELPMVYRPYEHPHLTFDPYEAEAVDGFDDELDERVEDDLDEWSSDL
jgi:hypothetical protein